MAIIEIKSRYDQKVIFSAEATSIKMCLEIAVKKSADLGGADLGDAYLGGADLRGAYLGGADLGDVKTPPITDHYFTSEILFRFAKTENQKNFAARVRMELNLCWNDFYKLAQKMKVTKWAEKTLSKWDGYKVKIAELKK